MMKSKYGKVKHYRDQKYEKIKKQLREQGCIFTDLTFPACSGTLGTNTSDFSPAIEWKRPRVKMENNAKKINRKFPLFF